MTTHPGARRDYGDSAFSGPIPLLCSSVMSQDIEDTVKPSLRALRPTSQADRKELLHILIEDITVNVAGDRRAGRGRHHVADGHQTAGQAVRPVARLDQLSYYPALLARVTELADVGRNIRQIVDALSAEGFRPPQRTSRFSGQQIRILIS